MRPRFHLCCLAALALAGCEAPPEADFRPSEAARTAPPPQLIETAMFGGALARSGPDAERLSAEADALAARAAALAARAEALSGPVIAPDDRRQLGADGE